jgi:glycosyltransferase involved in cell wall biosynthesis
MAIQNDSIEAKSLSVSIIIPIYNVEAYITDCLESICMQDYLNIEVILVDDKTPDKSMVIAGPIIEKIRQKYPVLVINHDVNKGLSAARNTGIKAANGDYVYFLDSDDALKPYAISCLVKFIKKYGRIDVVIGNYIVLTSEHPETIPISGYFNDKDSILKIFLENKIHIMAWNKLIRRSFLLANNIFFENGLLSEDVLFSYQTALKAESIFIASEATYIYNYGIRADSLCISYTYKHMSAFLYITRKKIELFNNLPLYAVFYEHILKYCYHLLLLTYRYNIENKRHIIGELKDIISTIDPVKIQSKKTLFKKTILSLPSFVIGLYFPSMIYIKRILKK